MSSIIVALCSGAGFLGASTVARAGNRMGATARSIAVAVAAGILLAVAFADLFPEALELAGERAVWAFVGGFSLLLVVETWTRGHTHHAPDDHVHRHATTPFVVGLALHNIADGFVLGVAGPRSPQGALVVGAGVLIHQVPVGISLAAVLAASRTNRSEQLRLALPLAAAIPLTTVVSSLLLSPSDRALGLLVGTAGGLLTYMAAAHLLPEAQREHRSRLPAIGFVATLALATLLLTAPH